MRIEVNGEPREVPAGITVDELLDRLGLAGQVVAVERNKDIVPRSDHARAEVHAGDRLEIVHFVGGG